MSWKTLLSVGISVYWNVNSWNFQIDQSFYKDTIFKNKKLLSYIKYLEDFWNKWKPSAKGT